MSVFSLSGFDLSNVLWSSGVADDIIYPWLRCMCPFGSLSYGDVDVVEHIVDASSRTEDGIGRYCCCRRHLGVCLTGSSFDVKLMVSCSNPESGEVPFFMLFAVYASCGSFVGAATTVNVEFVAVSPSAFVKSVIRSPDVVRAIDWFSEVVGEWLH